MGKAVKDLITGFEGTVTGSAEYITGCDQHLVQPVCKGDGSYHEGKWFDDSRLEIVDSKVVELNVDKEKPGACGEAPIK